MSKNEVSVKEVYELVDKMRTELISHVLRLESKFDTLEAGRLSAAEKRLAEVTAEIEPLKRIIYGMVGTVLLAVLGALLYLVIK